MNQRQIKARNIKVFLKTFFAWKRVPVLILLIWLTVSIALSPMGDMVVAAILVFIASIIILGVSAYFSSIPKRFYNPKFLELWHSCRDRHKRLLHALKAMRRHKIADLSELPKTSEKILKEMYTVLRAADHVYHEVHTSEMPLRVYDITSEGRYMTDHQAAELLKLADRNKFEYSQHFKATLASVERAEGQALVFATTLDNLRLQMLNYRLSGHDQPHALEFLSEISEAKMQFAAIDKALYEIELMPFAQVVATIPPTQEQEEHH